MKPELSREVTPSSDNLLMRDLPRPDQPEAGTGSIMPFASGAPTDAAYNTVDLGDPGTSADVLRPVELETEPASPSGGVASRADAATPTVSSRPSLEMTREAVESPSAPPRDFASTTIEKPSPASTPQTGVPKKNPNLKASLAEGFSHRRPAPEWRHNIEQNQGWKEHRTRDRGSKSSDILG